MADSHSVDQLCLHFTAHGFHESVFRVAGLQCSNHDLSTDYRFELVVTSEQAINPKDLTNIKARLTLRRDHAPVHINGLVIAGVRVGQTLSGFEYQVVLVSPLNRLKLNRQSRIFQKQSVTEILAALLTTAGLAPETDFQFKQRLDYPQRAIVVQFEESDYDFLGRQLAHWGLFYYFEQSETQAKLIITDNVDDAPTLSGTGTLNFLPQISAERSLEVLFHIKTCCRMRRAEIRHKEYSYRIPGDVLESGRTNQSNLPGWGSDYRYGEHYMTREEGEWVALVRQQALGWQCQTYIAESNCVGLAPGCRFSLTNHPEHHLNGDYFIVKVAHTAEQSASVANTWGTPGSHYRNKLLLIRAGTPYRQPMGRISKQVPVTSYFTAELEIRGNDYAYLDKQGRFRERLAFDLGDAKQGETSYPGMLQSCAGKRLDFCFPLRGGTEVSLVCVNGDPDRPVVRRDLPNSNTPSPLIDDNSTQNNLRTWGWNALQMEDIKGAQRIELLTHDRRKRLTHDAHSDGHSIELLSEQAATNAALETELRAALGVDLKPYTGLAPESRIRGDLAPYSTLLKPKQGSLKGRPEQPHLNANADMVRSLLRQNESAEILASRGLDVAHLSNDAKKGGKPDLNIGGRPVDGYFPKSKNLNTILDNMAHKVEHQAPDIVLNLSDSPISPHDMLKFLQGKTINGLQNLYLIKDDEVVLKRF
jgi:type VI secretion system secreted protein VgrG